MSINQAITSLNKSPAAKSAPSDCCLLLHPTGAKRKNNLLQKPDFLLQTHAHEGMVVRFYQEMPMSTKANTKRKLFDAQQIGWMTDGAREHAASKAKQVATDQATLAYNRAYADTYDSTFKAEFERAVYQTTKDSETRERQLPF